MDSELIAWSVEAGRFADVRLMTELQQLARVDRRSEARILVLLAEVDERQLFLAQGYSSLFRYAVCVLRMSEAQAYLRISAARVTRSYPTVLEMLVEGALNLSTVKLLAPQLTTENHATLLERARNKTKREVELLIAEIAPKPDVQTRIRKLPRRPVRTGSAQSELVMSTAPGVQETTGTPTTMAAAATAPATIGTHIATEALDPDAEAAHAAIARQAAAATEHATITKPVATRGLEPCAEAVGAESEPGTAAAAHAAMAPHATAATAHATIGTRVASAALALGAEAVDVELEPGTAAAAHAATAPRVAAAVAPAMITTPVATAALEPRVEDAAPYRAAASSPSAAAAVAPRAAAAFALEAPRASCAVLSPGRYRLELTVDQALFDQLMMLKHLLKHRVPSGDLGAVLGFAIKEFSERLCKQRFAELSKPASRAQASRSKAPAAPRARASQNEVAAGSRTRASQDEAPMTTARFSQRGSVVEHGADKVERRSRYVPREVVRAVFARDGAQCTFIGADGKRCAERGMLELHHIKAFAHGGAATPGNLKVVCRSHNSYFATQDFGASHMRMMRVRAR